jgi:hypothetical protein
MSSLIFGLRFVVFNFVWQIAFRYTGDTLQQKETECRGSGLSLAAVAA